jgi:small subunit ribosomal protein S2
MGSHRADDRAPGGGHPVVDNQGKKDYPTMAVVTIRQLLESGVHFGHQTRRWNPR